MFEDLIKKFQKIEENDVKPLDLTPSEYLSDDEVREIIKLIREYDLKPENFLDNKTFLSFFIILSVDQVAKFISMDNELKSAFLFFMERIHNFKSKFIHNVEFMDKMFRVYCALKEM